MNIVTLHHRLGQTKCFVKIKKNSIPVIYICGGPGASHHSARALFELDRTVVLYDQLCCGESTLIGDKRKWSIGTWVFELSQVIEYCLTKISSKGVHLLGHSWGTMIAVDYLLSKKRKGINSLILSSPMLSAKLWKNDAVKLRLELPLEIQDILNKNEKNNTTSVFEYKMAEKEYNKRFVYRSMKKGADQLKGQEVFNKELYEYLWGPNEFFPIGKLKNYERVKKIDQIKGPTLICCGEFDEATPKTCEIYHNKIKDSEFIVLKNASHSGLHEENIKYLQMVSDFLNKWD